MKNKIIFTFALIAAMIMLLSGCVETYMLYKLLSDDEDSRPERSIEAARGEIFELEDGSGRYLEFYLDEEMTQGDVKITVYGARFYEDNVMDNGETKSFLDFYVSIENLSPEDMAFVYYHYSDVRLSTGEWAVCSWPYSDAFELAYDPGRYQEGVISYEIEHTEIKDLAGADIRLTPLCDEEGSLLRPTDPYVFDFNFAFIHDEYEKSEPWEFKQKVYSDLKTELIEFGTPYKTNSVCESERSGDVLVTVPAVALYDDREMDFGITYDIVAVAVLYEFDTAEEIQFEPRYSYILCDGSRRIDCDWELCRKDCYHFLNGQGMASYILYFPLKDEADIEFENLHFVISPPLDLDTFEDLGKPISMDFAIK